MKKILFMLIPISLFSQELKVATYNVDNLFDLTYNKSEYKEYIPNTHNWNSNTFNKKIENISRVICELNADVIGLEEVENKNVLDILQKRLAKKGCKYRYSAITHNKGAINEALLSKVKIKNTNLIKVSQSPRDRDILEVTLDTKPKLKIFVNHWRSKAAPESKRVIYAKALVNRLNKLPSTTEYIIIGDFNSNYNECSVISAKNNDTNGVCGIDTILKTFYNGRLLMLRNKLNLDRSYHYNLWSEIASPRRWSHEYYGHKGSLDSIIVPKNMLDSSGWFYKKDSFNVFNKRFLFKKGKKGMLNVWEYKHSKHTGHGYSDHLPIYAIFSNSQKKELKHESILDKFWKKFIPYIKKEKSINTSKVNIDTLAKIKFLKQPVVLDRACVIYKRGDIGVIKSSKNSKSITLYKCAEGLKEGSCYSFKIYKKKKYYGLDEILDLDVLKKEDSFNTDNFIKDFKIDKLNSYKVGDIVKSIRGVYEDNYLYIDNNRVKLFVKEKRRGILKKRSKLYINKAQIGYYKGEKELVVYSADDIIKEN